MRPTATFLVLSLSILAFLLSSRSRMDASSDAARGRQEEELADLQKENFRLRQSVRVSAAESSRPDASLPLTNPPPALQSAGRLLSLLADSASQPDSLGITTYDRMTGTIDAEVAERIGLDADARARVQAAIDETRRQFGQLARSHATVQANDGETLEINVNSFQFVKEGRVLYEGLHESLRALLGTAALSSPFGESLDTAIQKDLGDFGLNTSSLQVTITKGNARPSPKTEDFMGGSVTFSVADGMASKPEYRIRVTNTGLNGGGGGSSFNSSNGDALLRALGPYEDLIPSDF